MTNKEKKLIDQEIDKLVRENDWRVGQIRTLLIELNENDERRNSGVSEETSHESES